MNYIAEIKCKDGGLYVGLMNRPHCSTNCALHDYKDSIVEYSFPITENYHSFLQTYLNGDTENGLDAIQNMNVKKSIKYLNKAISKLQGHWMYGKFSDKDESDYYKATPKHVITALTHLKEMAEECVDGTCTWKIRKEI